MISTFFPSSFRVCYKSSSESGCNPLRFATRLIALSKEMQSELRSEKNILRITRVFPARADTVFEIWSNPNVLKLLWHPLRAHIVRMDLQPLLGRNYSISANNEGSRTISITGRFLRVEFGKVLEYTWTLKREDKSIEENGVVLVEFLSFGNQTKLKLIQTGLRDRDSRDIHRRIWLNLIDALQHYFRTS